MVSSEAGFTKHVPEFLVLSTFLHMNSLKVNDLTDQHLKDGTLSDL